MKSQKIILSLSWIWTIVLLFSLIFELNLPYISAFAISNIPATISLNWLNYCNISELILVIVMTLCFLLSKYKLKTSNLLALQIILLLQTFWLLPLLNNKLALLLNSNENVLLGLFYLNIILIFVKMLILIRLRLSLRIDSIKIDYNK